MKTTLHQLIPESIRAQLNFQQVKISLTMTGVSAQGRWPCVRISCNQLLLEDCAIIGTQCLDYEFTATQDQKCCVLEIVYYNKTDRDTVVDDQGQILQNQKLIVDQIVINGVDLVKTKLLYQDLGAYIMDLDSTKRQYFLYNGIDTGPNHSLIMGENGIWTIKLGIPVLSFLSQKQQQIELAEQQNTQHLLEEIYQKVTTLQQQQSTI